MTKTFCLVFLLIAVSSHSQSIRYYAEFPNAVHHEARITMEIKGARTQDLVFRMSRSSPGRYATHEFGKNVYDVSVSGTPGARVRKTEGDVYKVSGIKGNLKLSYTLYGNHADGTYASINEAGIHLNMPASFMWVEGLEKSPVEIEFKLPDPSFSIATQLKPGRKPNTFSAPDLQYFLDSPVKIGKLHWREWTVQGAKKPMTIRLALESAVSAAGVDSLAAILEEITEQASKVFGEYPAFDLGNYTFIASMHPYVAGDGMEHRNSTMITLPVAFTTRPEYLDVFAHEFFHAWNVERIRPKTLEPFNFRKSNLSHELWFAEGFTQYYGELLMVRSQQQADSNFRGSLGAFINQRVNTPGGTMYTPIEASHMAVFTDAGISVDKTNYSNIFTSYYYYGAALALALDLELRSRFRSSLDLFMQEMWKRHGRKEVPYTLADMQEALAAVSTPAFARQFFIDQVSGTRVPDYAGLLAHAGMELKPALPGKAWMGNLRTVEKNGLVIAANTQRNTPAYEAGLDVNDTIFMIDTDSVRTAKDLARILEAHQPGERVQVHYLRRGRQMAANVQLRENPALEVTFYEHEGKKLTPEMIRFRQAWLGRKQDR